MGDQRKKVAVLYVDQAVAFGGSLIVMGHAIDALDKEKFRPVVVAELDRSILKNHIKTDVPVYIIRRLFNYMHFMKVSAMVNKLPGRYFRKIVDYMVTAVPVFANSLYFFSLMKLVIVEKIDLIHVNNGMNNFIPILVALLLRRKFVVHFHGIEELGRLQKHIIDKVPKFIAISEFIKDRMIVNQVPEDQMVVIPNPVKAKDVTQSEVDALCEEYDIKNDDLLIGIVGRITRWKGHVEFFQAVTFALEAVPTARVMVIGDISDGDARYQKHLQNMVDETGYKERVIFTGYMPDVSVFYKVLDLCVHCSIEPEPFGLVITEAMSYGVAVIAADLGAPKEIISDGENGYIVNPLSTEILAETMIRLLTDDGLRKRIGESGKRHVEANYRLEGFGQSLEGVYLDLIEGVR